MSSMTNLSNTCLGASRKIGKGLCGLNLILGERLHHAASEIHRADGLVRDEHGDGQHGPSADGAKDDIRKVVVGVLDELGVEHPLAREARRRLAAALY